MLMPTRRSRLRAALPLLLLPLACAVVMGALGVANKDVRGLRGSTARPATEQAALVQHDSTPAAPAASAH